MFTFHTSKAFSYRTLHKALPLICFILLLGFSRCISATVAAGGSTLHGCVAGSGTCFDTFAGAKGADLSAYNPNWVNMSGNGSISTTGLGSTTIGSGMYAYYAYAGSTSEVSQITVDPSLTPEHYTHGACVRMTQNNQGYCVSFAGRDGDTYSNCLVTKSGWYIGRTCGPVNLSTSHTLAIAASGSSTVTLSIYLDGVNMGTVIDDNDTYTTPGSGFGLRDGGSSVSSWRDYLGTISPNPAMLSLPYRCTAGSGSCADTFAGAAGSSIPAYNSGWVRTRGASDAYVKSGNMAEIAANGNTFYYYALSGSDTSQITMPPSPTAQTLSRQACTRMQNGTMGYCVVFGKVLNGRYSGCPVLKAGIYIGNGNCASPLANVSHTLAISGTGITPTTLSVYLDGVFMGSVVDAAGYAPGHPGFGLVGDGTVADTDVSTWKDSHETVNAPVTSAPVFTPAGGAYTSTQAVTLSSSTPNTYFFYTTDGSTPTTASIWYRGPITVAAGVTIRALGYAQDTTPSPVSTAVYTVGPPVVQTPAFAVSSPYAGPSMEIPIVNNTSGATVLYCKDGTNTCTPSTPYSSAVPFTSSGYIRAKGVRSGWTPSTVASFHGLVSTLAITTTTCPAAAQYQQYAGCTIAATGGVAPYTFGWSTDSGNAMVEGLKLSPLTGIIAGKAFGQGTYSILFTVTDITGATVSKTINIPVNGDNSLGGCSLFPQDSVWHMNVSALPVDTSVAAPIPSFYAPAHLHMVIGNYVDDGGIPFMRVPYNQPKVPVTTTMYQSYFTSAPFPADAPVEGTSNSGPNGDRHVLVLQTAGGGSNCKLWEMWQGVATQNGWTASSNAYWDLSSYDMLPQDNGSTDAAGLPVLPLLWTYDEVAGNCAPGAECGVVKHPGRLTLNHTLNYHVWPATAQAGTGGCSGGYMDDNRLISQSNPPASCNMSAPMGEIYRLKSSATSVAACVGHPQAQVLITAMRNYGLIVADNGITGATVATADSRWNDADLSCLTNITLTDFEPVNVSSKMIDLNSSQVRP